ncbi:YopX family protein [Heyndrickxia coagulans]|uniref:YopX family protein n=1 Tax=Heyndrickxia coagulans TaxID=1398 RepID=UPI0007797170|nr:YopX family protein [Heyndrickxia coagulans]
MREIKFRGKRVEDNEWIFGYYVVTHDSHRIIYEDYEGFYCEEEVIPESVGQWTGLFDRHGKEIYEGDILEAEHKLNTQKFMRKYQVIFNERGYWDAISLDDKPVRLCYAGFDKCKAIGNIYENPELLEANDE